MLFRAILGILAACPTLAPLVLAQAPASPAAGGGTVEATPAQRRKQQALAQIYREAAAAKEGSAERGKLQDEFLERSAEYVAELPDAASVWVLRAAICLERDRAREGWEAGRALVRLGLENSADPAVQQLLVQLERKNWLGEKPPVGTFAVSAATLSDEDRLELATLQRMMQTAPNQRSPAAIKAGLGEVLKRSAGFVEKHPDYLPVWLLRARLALELNQRKAGVEAGRKLKELGALTATEPNLLATMAELNARDWLSEKAAAVTEAEEGKPFTIADLGLTVLPIPAGRFTMGSPSTEADRGSDEGPQTSVALRAFWLGKTEVTQGQWQALMGSNPSHYKGEALPVETVSWDEAMEFCRKLTAREREAGRLPDGYICTLPTEAQWEYACRAGTTTAHAGDLDAMAWYRENSGVTKTENKKTKSFDYNYEKGKTHAVGSKQANVWGLQDMHGNVWEWCLDWYADKLPGGSSSDPTGPASGSGRVLRGGGWDDSADGCRSAYRGGDGPGNRYRNLGFRLALSSVP